MPKEGAAAFADFFPCLDMVRWLDRLISSRELSEKILMPKRGVAGWQYVSRREFSEKTDSDARKRVRWLKRGRREGPCEHAWFGIVGGTPVCCEAMTRLDGALAYGFTWALFGSPPSQTHLSVRHYCS